MQMVGVTYHSHCCPPVQQKRPWWGWESSSSAEVWSPQSDVRTDEWYPGGVVEKWHRHTLLILESLRWETLTAFNDWSKRTMGPSLHQSQSNILFSTPPSSPHTCSMQPSTNKVATKESFYEINPGCWMNPIVRRSTKALSEWRRICVWVFGNNLHYII